MEAELAARLHISGNKAIPWPNGAGLIYNDCHNYVKECGTKVYKNNSMIGPGEKSRLAVAMGISINSSVLISEGQRTIGNPENADIQRLNSLINGQNKGHDFRYENVKFEVKSPGKENRIRAAQDGSTATRDMYIEMTEISKKVFDVIRKLDELNRFIDPKELEKLNEFLESEEKFGKTSMTRSTIIKSRYNTMNLESALKILHNVTNRIYGGDSVLEHRHVRGTDESTSDVWQIARSYIESSENKEAAVNKLSAALKLSRERSICAVYMEHPIFRDPEHIKKLYNVPASVTFKYADIVTLVSPTHYVDVTPDAFDDILIFSSVTDGLRPVYTIDPLIWRGVESEPEPTCLQSPSSSDLSAAL